MDLSVGVGSSSNRDSVDYLIHHLYLSLTFNGLAELAVLILSFWALSSMAKCQLAKGWCFLY